MRRQRYPARSNLNAQIEVVPFLNDGWLTRTRNAPRLLSARCVDLIGIRDQVCVFSFSPFLHSVLNFAYCSLVRIPFASCLYFASLASEQPAL